MMLTGLAGALLVLSGIWHLVEWLMGGRNRDTVRLIPFGAVYLVLGGMIVWGAGFWVQGIALVCVGVGLVGALVLRQTSMVRMWVTWTFIAIDALIVAALVLGWVV